MHAAAGTPAGTDTIQALLEAGADVRAQDALGRSPLYRAVTRNDTSHDGESISRLVEAGAVVNERDAFGTTPLHAAAKAIRTPQAVQLLIELGANIDARDAEGNTALHYAVNPIEDPDAVKPLWSRMHRSRWHNSEGLPSLELQSARIVRELLERGA